MVGNKHKNGIICTFPNCNKPMRTQKFKMHFTRMHLKDGEVYSVKHRRQYEVAREENARSSVKHELVTAVPATPSVMLMAGRKPSCVVSANSATESLRENAQTSQAKQETSIQSQQVELTSQAESSTTKSEENTANISANPLHYLPMSGNVPLSGDHTSGRKRSASAVEALVETVDPTSVLLLQFIALMDQRFQELVGKMGEMIDVQKTLIDTLQARKPHGQAPTSAASHAVDVVLKRRKKDTSPRSDNNGVEDVNGSSNTDTDADGPSSGFVL
ncbi:hypothetical protein KXD40_004845 [Peronospora effusa]|uniref:Uncharacterized protein n=1 Tax=Peronospora effusa TaxID=542832 RepID=A0A3M6VT34_9STRA|nr:hypothetical protein DD238_001544 [Peronospora effusa]RQM17492.1 hypothetical protein DD237_002158 [Peronospora effusa]UIZ22572.1 hypothetical protein KXD40_004845 [Peronospora effusa]CAI5708804.1 unnamed protein product [Peronospora effusa]